MKLILEIPEYNPSSGLESTWEDGFEIEVENINGITTITANKAGLISLATQLLTLAQETVPSGAHFHFDEFGCLENGSSEMIIGKK